MAQPDDYVLNATEAVTHPYNEVTKYNLQGKQTFIVQIFVTNKTALSHNYRISHAFQFELKSIFCFAFYAQSLLPIHNELLALQDKILMWSSHGILALVPFV